MLAIGSITRKETKFITNAHDPHGPAQAISLLAVPAKISKELWETFGFAPYLIVLITFLASAIVARRLWIRRRLRLPVLIWLVLWFAVMAVVARRLGYLDGRHTLILVLFLYPLLAVAFFAITQSLRYLLKSNAIPRLVTALVFLAAFLPGIILLRIPTRADKAFLRTAANWVAVNTSPDDVVYDYEQLVGYYAHRPYKQWLGTPSAPALESLPSIQETPYLLAYHYYPGETPQPNIGPYHAIATFHSTNGKETLILYALPIH